MKKSKEEIALENEEKLQSGKHFKKNLLTLLCFLLLGIGVIIWFGLIKLIEHSTDNIYLLSSSIFAFIIYFIFNILVLGNMNINEHKKKISNLRKDVQIFSVLSKVFSFLLIIFNIIVSVWFYLETKKIIYTLIPIFILGGFTYLYVTMSFTFDNNIKEHKKIEINDVTLTLLFIAIGVIIYVLMPKSVFNINDYININNLLH